jgi:hypothetical protein
MPNKKKDTKTTPAPAPKAKAKGKDKDTVPWKKGGPDCVQLFRDLYFKRYTDKTPPLQIYWDPERGYSKYSLSYFCYDILKKTRNTVNTYRSLGTGLESDDYREKLKLHLAPPPAEGQSPFFANVERQQATEEKEEEPPIEYFCIDNLKGDEFGEEEDGEDVSYKPHKSVEDEELDGFFELESLLSGLSIKEKNIKAIRKTIKGNKMFINTKFGKKYLSELADGRFVCVAVLPSGWEGSIYVSECQEEIWMKTEIPSFLTKAKEIFRFSGATEEYNYIMSLQATIDKAKDQDEDSKTMELNEKLFELPTKVNKKFTNSKGEFDNMFSVYVDPVSKKECACFFLIPENRRLLVSPEPKACRRVAPRSREQITPRKKAHPAAAAASRSNTPMEVDTAQSTVRRTAKKQRPTVIETGVSDVASPRFMTPSGVTSDDEYTWATVRDNVKDDEDYE